MTKWHLGQVTIMLGIEHSNSSTFKFECEHSATQTIFLDIVCTIHFLCNGFSFIIIKNVHDVNLSFFVFLSNLQD